LKVGIKYPMCDLIYDLIVNRYNKHTIKKVVSKRVIKNVAKICDQSNYYLCKPSLYIKSTACLIVTHILNVNR